MNDKEKGFTYPLTLIIFLLFLLFFSAKVEQLLAERKMAHETMIILQEEYYYLSSIKKTEKLYLSGAVPLKGVFTFSNGTMEYQTEKPIGTSQGINFTLRLHSGETAVCRGTFDTGSKKLIKWVEMK